MIVTLHDGGENPGMVWGWCEKLKCNEKYGNFVVDKIIRLFDGENDVWSGFSHLFRNFNIFAQLKDIENKNLTYFEVMTQSSNRFVIFWGQITKFDGLSTFFPKITLSLKQIVQPRVFHPRNTSFSKHLRGSIKFIASVDIPRVWITSLFQ